MKFFRWSIAVTGIALLAAYLAGSWSGVLLALVLGVLEISLSFDNAVINAAILREMDPRWQRYFLTWGMLIAVFGMRLLFPILIVAVATSQGMGQVADLALHQPERYGEMLSASRVEVAAFGGMFLLLVFFSFLFDEGRELHWLEPVERRLAAIGKLESIEVAVALATLLAVRHLLDSGTQQVAALNAGILGIILYVLVGSFARLLEQQSHTPGLEDAFKRSGVMGFVYLELLDASFSFDGVIGAFAITKDVLIIMCGLGIGAMFVRSLTVYLVRKGTLDQFVFLEHGAYYAIGALALITLYGLRWHVPEVVTGLVGAVFIGAALFSSLRHRRLEL